MKRARICGAWLLMLCGATIASAQKFSTEPFEQNDGYVNLLAGDNLGGVVAGDSLTATGSGSSSSISVSGLATAAGFAGGVEAGWYKSIFGAEIEDLLARDGLAPSNVTFSGNSIGGSVSGTFDQFKATQNFLLFNGLLRFFRQDTSWGLWYPYTGAGLGFVSGSASNATTGASGYSLQTSHAGDIQFGVAGTWDNGFGLSVEYQTLISGYYMVLPPTTYSGATSTATLSGTAINSVLNLGLSYHFHL